MLLYTFTGCVLLLIQLPLGWTAGYLLKTIGFGLCMAGMKELAQHFYGTRNESNHGNPPVRTSGLGGIAVWRTVKKHLTFKQDDPTDPIPPRLSLLDMLARNALICGAICLTASGVAAVFEFFAADKSSEAAFAANISAVILGIIGTLTALRLVYGVIVFLENNDRAAKASQQLTGITDEDGNTELSESSDPDVLAAKRTHKKLILTDNFTDILRLKSAFEKTAICSLVNLACDVLNRAVPIEAVQTYAGFLAAISKLTLYVFVIITALKFNEVRKGVDRKMGIE